MASNASNSCGDANVIADKWEIMYGPNCLDSRDGPAGTGDDGLILLIPRCVRTRLRSRHDSAHRVYDNILVRLLDGGAAAPRMVLILKDKCHVANLVVTVLYHAHYGCPFDTGRFLSGLDHGRQIPRAEMVALV